MQAGTRATFHCFGCGEGGDAEDFRVRRGSL
jgi:DNA primase